MPAAKAARPWPTGRRRSSRDSSARGLPAPHAEDHGDEEGLQEPVSGMDGGQLHGHALPDGGAGPHHEAEPDPEKDGKLRRMLPGAGSKTRDEQREHAG